VSGLKSKYEAHGHQFSEEIEKILAAKPRLQKKYKRPDVGSDRLYPSAVTHPVKDERECSEACKSHQSQLKTWTERNDDEDNPAIHYGTIASSNQLMKDALFRDKLAEKHEILCFEMEAAGLMNHFPCLVVRGICDYSDTHKNKRWQGYAAMAAAAYAKDLLCRIPPNRIEAEQRISKVLFG
jgi:nucleoside phosphorylase